MKNAARECRARTVHGSTFVTRTGLLEVALGRGRASTAGCISHRNPLWIPGPPNAHQVPSNLRQVPGPIPPPTSHPVAVEGPGAVEHRQRQSGPGTAGIVTPEARWTVDGGGWHSERDLTYRAELPPAREERAPPAGNYKSAEGGKTRVTSGVALRRSQPKVIVCSQLSRLETSRVAPRRAGGRAGVVAAPAPAHSEGGAERNCGLIAPFPNAVFKELHLDTITTGVVIRDTSSFTGFPHPAGGASYQP